MPAFPNGRCYCGCGTPLRDRTAFWARGHDASAAHRVIQDHYGNVADFVVAHDSDTLALLRRQVGILESLVFPQGRERGPLFSHPRTLDQWEEMRQLSAEVDRVGVPVDCPGAWAVLYLAHGLLKEHEKYAKEAPALGEPAARAEWGPFRRIGRTAATPGAGASQLGGAGQ